MTAPSITAALTAVMRDVTHVAKRDVNQHQRFNFRGIDATVNAVGPALRAHGVIVVPELVTADYDVVQTTTGKPSTACRVVVAYVFHGPAGDSIRSVVAGEAWDAGDKATPKAMSVAFRTALLQALALPTDEPDPDTHTYERSEDQSGAEAFALLKEIAAATPDKAGVKERWAAEHNGEDINAATDLPALRALRDELTSRRVTA